MESDLNSLMHVPCALLVVDRDLKPLSGSRKGFSVFGVRLRRAAAQPAIEELARAILAAPGFPDRAREAAGQATRPGSEVSFRWERGGRVYEVTVSSLGWGEVPRYALLFDDVTQQIRFEETRELARRYLEDILNNIRVGVVVLNGEMRITNVNRAQEAFLRRMGVWISWVEAIGMPIAELVPQDPKARWEEITERVLVQGQAYEDPRRTYPTPEGELVLSVEITPLRDQKGEAIGAIQVSEDVTERVRLEEELQEAEIVAERLEAVRQTAVTVNHEVNNPLSSILGVAQMLLISEKGLSEGAQERLRLIERNVRRIAEVTRRLRAVEEVKTTDYLPDGPKMLDIGPLGDEEKE